MNVMLLFVFAIIVLLVLVLVLLFSRKEVEKNSEEKPVFKKQQVTVTPSSKSVPKKKNEINGHEYVDLGLPSGTLWATCNVGATRPEEYGDYFAWGETKLKEKYAWERKGDYKWGIINWYDKTNYGMLKYNKTDGKTVLDPEDDAAHVNWGGAWRMPTKEEFEELLAYCSWLWITQNEANGYKVTGQNGNSIFLPAAGFRRGSSLSNAGSYGFYWSSSLDTSRPSGACYVGFYSGYYDWNYDTRCNGHSVRAVCSAR